MWRQDEFSFKYWLRFQEIRTWKLFIEVEFQELRMEMKTQLLIVLVVCIAVATSEKYCPQIRDNRCGLGYKINDCCSQGECPSYAICCKLPCGNVCKNPSDSPTNGVALKDGEECKLGHVYPKTGLEWLFGSKSK